MTLSFPRALEATSPTMLICSVCLHGLVLISVVFASSLIISPRKPAEEGINRVKLVEVNTVERPLEKAQRGPVRTHDVEADSVMEEAPASEEFLPLHQEKVEAKIVSSHSADAIPVRKRTRSAQKVEVPKKSSKDNSPSEVSKNSADNLDVIEKRLASIRREVQTRKTNSSSPASSRTADSSGSSDRSGPKLAGNSASEDLARWFEAVRTRINSHWSLFGDTRKVDRLTVIGIKLDDDGRLADASVDESSGDPVFDRSAVRAVFQAAPFPPVPVEVRERIRTAGGLALRFTPGGIQ